MNKTDRALLLGMLIGDGCLKTKRHTQSDGKESVYYEYVLCHSIKQEEYLKQKLELFHSIMGGKKPKIHYEKIQLGDIEHISCHFSRCHKVFRILHKYLYSKNNKKFLTERVLNYLTPQAIAIWYMDDGGLSKSKRPDGSISSIQMRLNTYCTLEEAISIQKMFRHKYQINCNINKYGKKDQYNIRFNTTEAKKLEELIKDYMVPSMFYKLPSNWIPRALDLDTSCL
jgi:hypothetical protein